MYTASTKQKINMKSSTKAELVAINDSMAQVLWTRHFLASQGICVPTTTIYQDNKSTILLAKNGKTSSSRRTKHLDIRYFFITDKIKKGEVKVAFCPTQNMLADFFTKPLQGSMFICMRENILNLPVNANTNCFLISFVMSLNTSSSVTRFIRSWFALLNKVDATVLNDNSR